MKKVVTIVLLCLVTGIPCFSGSIPSVTAQVNVVEGVKEYIYTLTNDLAPGVNIFAFSVFMPEAGALAVTNAWSSKEEEGWFVARHLQGDYSSWSVGVRYDYLFPGKSLILKLTTSAGVPTAYDYIPGSWPSNWEWYKSGTGRLFGNGSLPVPAPEPSSLLALGLAASGLGGVALRRRWR